MALTLLVTVVTCTFGFVAMIAGIFGMNLWCASLSPCCTRLPRRPSGLPIPFFPPACALRNVGAWQEDKAMFVAVCTGSSVAGVALLLGVLWYIRSRRLMFIPNL